MPGAIASSLFDARLVPPTLPDLDLAIQLLCELIDREFLPALAIIPGCSRMKLKHCIDTPMKARRVSLVISVSLKWSVFTKENSHQRASRSRSLHDAESM
jgi:hypothetical protein